MEANDRRDMEAIKMCKEGANPKNEGLASCHVRPTYDQHTQHLRFFIKKTKGTNFANNSHTKGIKGNYLNKGVTYNTKLVKLNYPKLG